MKKTIKRALLLITVVAVMMTVAVFAMAADCEHSYSKSVTVYPTCTENGYTISVCVDCGKEVTITNLVSPVNHGLLDRVYTLVGDSYELTRDCGKVHKHLVRNADGSIKFDAEDNAVYEDVACDFVYKSANTYYSVSFVNPCVSAATDPAIAYTAVTTALKAEKLAVTNKAEAVFDEDNTTDPVKEYYNNGSEIILFVKAGTTAEYKGATPLRNKDYNYGAYKFAGWSKTNNVASTNVDASGIITLSEAAINENTTFFARFEGETKYYVVNFSDYDSTPLSGNGIIVCHGQKVTFDAAEPKRDADVANTYVFSGWVRDGKEVSLDNIYANVSVVAKYDAIPNSYKVSYVDYKNNPIEFIDNGEYVTEETVVYGTESAAASFITKDMLAKAPDREFIYEFSGKWTFKENNKYFTTLNNLKVPEYYYDAEGNYVNTKNGDSFTLVPVYNSKRVVYTYRFQVVNTMFDDDDKSHTLKDFSIQIKDSSGQLIATGKTDSKGLFVTTLNYSLGYTITAVSADNKYLAEQFIAAPTYDDSTSDINYTLRPSRNPDYDSDHHSSCGCICHNTFFKPLIVRIYNILYRLFKIKYVCCYDMYANIGSVLVYTPDN